MPQTTAIREPIRLFFQTLSLPAQYACLIAIHASLKTRVRLNQVPMTDIVTKLVPEGEGRRDIADGPDRKTLCLWPHDFDARRRVDAR